MAVTFKPKRVKNRGWSYFVAPEKFFSTVIWFFIYKLFPTKLLPTKAKRLEYPKSNNHHTVVYLGKTITFKPKKTIPRLPDVLVVFTKNHRKLIV